MYDDNLFNLPLIGLAHPPCCAGPGRLLSPAEAARTAWALSRLSGSPLPPERWSDLVLGGATGLPVLRITRILCAGVSPFPCPGSCSVCFPINSQDAERAVEKRLVGRIVGAYLAHGVHAPTYDHPGGLMSGRAALFMGAALFYRFPPLPEDPAEDSEIIREWLSGVEGKVLQVKAMLCKPPAGSSL